VRGGEEARGGKQRRRRIRRRCVYACKVNVPMLFLVGVRNILEPDDVDRQASTGTRVDTPCCAIAIIKEP
jgi:hypothetical protein